jgi:hypothetical protein
MKEKLILQIMGLLSRIGVKPADFIGKGTNLIKFPKIDELTPFKPSLLMSMRTGGENSIKLAKQKFIDNKEYLMNANDMELNNFINNLQDYLEITGEGLQKATPEAGITSTPQAQLYDITTKQKMAPEVAEDITQRLGLPAEVSPESPVGSLTQSVNSMKALIDEINGVSPTMRAKMNQEMRNNVIQQLTEAGGDADIASELIRQSAGDVDYFSRVELPKYLQSFELKPQNKEQIDLVKNAIDDVYSSSERGFGEIDKTFKNYYSPTSIKYSIEDAINNEVLKTKKIDRDEFRDFVLENAPLSSTPIDEFLDQYSDILKDQYGFNLNKDFYKKYYDKFVYQDDAQYLERLRKIAPQTEPELKDGGRVGFSDGDITKTKADYEKELEELDFSLKKEDNKILDILDLQAQGSMSGEQQIAGAPAGVTSNKQVINAILKLDIPISEKINLIGDYQYGKFRNKIKYNDKEVYLEDPGSSKNRKIGLNYNEGGEGLSAAFRHNVDTGENDAYFQYKMPFATGGRVGFANGGRVTFAKGLGIQFMIEALVKLRNIPRQMLDYVSKRRNGAKQIQNMYEEAFGKDAEGVMSVVNEKMGPGTITTADEIERPEKAKLREMYEEFNKRQEERETIMRQDAEARAKDPEAAKEFDEMWDNPESFPRKNRQLTDEEIEEYEEILGDSETWMNEGTVEEAEAAVKRRKEYEQQMYSEYKVEKQGRKELEEAYKEIDFRMTGEDTKYEANELADMLSEIRYKTEYSDLPQKTQIDLYDEAYNYLMEVKRDAANFKGATNVKTGKNIVTGEQEFPVDPLTGKPRKLNAFGGLINGIGTLFEEK